MKIEGKSITMPCEPCLKGKQTHAEIQHSTETRTTSVLGQVFSDICGKMSTCSHGGYEYFVAWTDDAFHKVHISCLHAKLDVLQKLKDFVSWIELETGQCVKILCSNGGGEYTSTVIAGFLKNKGIKHELTMPNTPQHNGIAKCMNHTLLDRVRSILIDAGLPKFYWHNALQHATLIHNVSPTQALDNQTPEEAWSGNKPNVSRLHVFSCKAFVHIPPFLHTKLNS